MPPTFTPWLIASKSFGGLVVTGTFQFPLNRDGFGADVIYTERVEYTF